MPLQPHQQNSQQHQAPIQPLALPIQNKHHLSRSKALPQARLIHLLAVSTSTGRWLHTAMQESHNPVGVYSSSLFLPGPDSKQHLKPLCQALFSFRTLTTVSTESGCSHPGPTFSPEPAATPPTSSCHGSAMGHSAQYHW